MAAAAAAAAAVAAAEVAAAAAAVAAAAVAAVAAAVAAATPLSLIKPDRETGDYGIFATRNKGGNLGVVSRFEDLTLFASYRYQVSGLGISCKIPNRKKTRIFQRVGQKPESSKVCLMSKIPRIFKKIRDDETRTINSASGHHRC